MLVILGDERCDFFTNEHKSVCANDQVVPAKFRSPVKSNNLMRVFFIKKKYASWFVYAKTASLCACAHLCRFRLYASIVVTVYVMHRPVSICMLVLRTTFIMKDNSIKILLCCTSEMN